MRFWTAAVSECVIHQVLLCFRRFSATTPHATGRLCSGRNPPSAIPPLPVGHHQIKPGGSEVLTAYEQRASIGVRRGNSPRITKVTFYRVPLVPCLCARPRYPTRGLSAETRARHLSATQYRTSLPVPSSRHYALAGWFCPTAGEGVGRVGGRISREVPPRWSPILFDPHHREAYAPRHQGQFRTRPDARTTAQSPLLAGGCFHGFQRGGAEYRKGVAKSHKGDYIWPCRTSLFPSYSFFPSESP